MNPVSFAPAGGRLNLITARNLERARCGFGAGLRTSGFVDVLLRTIDAAGLLASIVRMISPVREPGVPSWYSASALTTT